LYVVHLLGMHLFICFVLTVGVLCDHLCTCLGLTIVRGVLKFVSSIYV